MGLVLRLVETRTDSRTHSVDVLKISQPGDLRDIANLGLMLPEARNARTTLKRIRTFLPTCRGKPARKLRRALRTDDRYLRGQSTWLVDYAERHRAGLWVGT